MVKCFIKLTSCTQKNMHTNSQRVRWASTTMFTQNTFDGLLVSILDLYSENSFFLSSFDPLKLRHIPQYDLGGILYCLFSFVYVNYHHGSEIVTPISSMFLRRSLCKNPAQLKTVLLLHSDFFYSPNRKLYWVKIA